MFSFVLRLTRFIILPKAKSHTSKSFHLKQSVGEFVDDVLSTDGDILYCKMCDMKTATEMATHGISTCPPRRAYMSNANLE
jgi:hypothetical protein